MANTFDNECLADEILRFFMETECNYDDFENFGSYPFKISFPGLMARLDNNNWKAQLGNGLSIKFIPSVARPKAERSGELGWSKKKMNKKKGTTTTTTTNFVPG